MLSGSVLRMSVYTSSSNRLLLYMLVYYKYWMLTNKAYLFFQPDIVNSLNLWALCGMGYFMGQFFQLKLVEPYLYCHNKG